MLSGLLSGSSRPTSVSMCPPTLWVLLQGKSASLKNNLLVYIGLHNFLVVVLLLCWRPSSHTCKEFLQTSRRPPVDDRAKDSFWFVWLDLPSSVAKWRVASLRHVVGVWSAAGGELPGTNGGRGSRRGSGAQIQHGLLGEALTFRAWAVFHLHDKVWKNVIKIKRNWKK